MTFLRALLTVVCAGLFVVAAGAQPTQGRRVALVIGNSAYTAQGALANPGPDSRLVADALRRVGFTVTAQNDLGKQAMERALRDFSRSADGAEVALVYYAGHGLEANGDNWLLPIDAQLADERDLSFEAISLDTVLGTVERARGLRMVVLDACRNNPFARSMRRSATTRATVTRGLADVEVTGTLVLYAARGGTVAQDGPAGGNSPFATAFARRVPEPGVDIRLLVSKVRDDVLAATRQLQEPFSYGSLPGITLSLNSRPLQVASSPHDVAQLSPAIAAEIRRARDTRSFAEQTKSRAAAAANIGRDIERKVDAGDPEYTMGMSEYSLEFRKKNFFSGEIDRSQVHYGSSRYNLPPLQCDSYAGEIVSPQPRTVGVYDFCPRRPNELGALRFIGEFFGENEPQAFDGLGEITYRDGRRYIGQVRSGSPNGRGVMTLQNGERWEGSFKDGRLDGLGAKWNSNGVPISAGTWSNGVLVRSDQ